MTDDRRERAGDGPAEGSQTPAAPSPTADEQEQEAAGRAEGRHGHHHRRRAEELETELRKVKTEYDQLLDTARRIKAEYENYRKRTESQFLERVDAEKAELLKGFLTVLDDAERALGHLDGQSRLEEWRQGLDLVLDRFRKLLGEHGVEVVDPQGQPFDPSVHEALVMVESPEVAEETVVEVFQKGYRMNGRLVRHAKVKVAKPALPPAGEAAAECEPQTPEGGPS